MRKMLPCSDFCKHWCIVEKQIVFKEVSKLWSQCLDICFLLASRGQMDNTEGILASVISL